MSLVPETGVGLASSNTYASMDFANTYHMARYNMAWLGGDVAEDLKAAALVRGTSYIDNCYRGQFPGYPRRGRLQALEWPRTDAVVLGYLYGSEYYTLPIDEIPVEIKNAVCEAALRELVKPGSLSPDLKEGGVVKSVTAGSVNVQFAGGYTGQDIFQVIDQALSRLLPPSNQYSGRVARG